MLSSRAAREERYLLHNLISTISLFFFSLFGRWTNIRIRARFGRPSDLRLR
jgi:hypothetical protein